jgi:hypothetical protein
MKSIHLNLPQPAPNFSYTVLLRIMLLLAAGQINLPATSQTLGEFKPKDQSYGVGKAKNATRVYISNFTVNYQVYNEKSKFKQGGAQFGGGYKGDAKAEASVGLAGLTEADVQQVTDKLYADFLAKLKESGLTVVNADEAAKTSTYGDFERLQGGKVSLAQFPGSMTTQPTGFDFFVKSIDKSGKTKAGGFFGNNLSQHANLSSQLDDAIIADVELYVLFVEDKEAFQGGGANVKIKTNLRLADQEAITMTKDSGFRFKGQNTVTAVNSAVKFTHGKMGMGATTSFIGMLDKPLQINGVVDDVKVTSFARGGADILGTKTIYGTYFMPEDRTSETNKVVPLDGKKYADGVYQAATKFITYQTSAFLDKRK